MSIDLGALRERTLPRQFPVVDSLETLIESIGPIQSQTARAPFLAAAARSRGEIGGVADAFESRRMVRACSIRGTVHASDPVQYAVLAATAARATRLRWARGLALTRLSVQEFSAEAERFCGDWRSLDELRAHLVDYLAEHDSASACLLYTSPSPRD